MINEYLYGGRWKSPINGRYKLTGRLVDWIAGIGEDTEVVLKGVGAGAEDKIFVFVGDGDLDPVDVVVDVIDYLAVDSEDILRVADRHAVSLGVLEGVESPLTVVAGRDDSLAGWEGAMLIILRFGARGFGRRDMFGDSTDGIKLEPTIGGQFCCDGVVDVLLLVGREARPES